VAIRSTKRWVTVSLVSLALTAAACSAGPPGAPPPSLGTVETRVIPASVANLPLTNQDGSTVTLASLQGKIVMLVPFLTLCSDVCPLTTGNLLQVEGALARDDVASKVQVVELSVDPDRDTTGRLAAYARLTGASWDLVTESDADLARIATFFGFTFQKVPQDSPPAVDWLTGKPLTYDINHSDGYVLIDQHGRERFSTGASPDFHGTLNPTLQTFLSDLGRQHLAHPQHPGWNPSAALQSLSWMLGTTLVLPN